VIPQALTPNRAKAETPVTFVPVQGDPPRYTADPQVVPRPSVAAEAWDAVASASEDAWLWHRHVFPEALATWKDTRDFSFALVDDHGELVAVMPLLAFGVERARGAVRIAHFRSPGGPAIAHRIEGAARQRLRRAAVNHAVVTAKAHRGVWLRVSLPPLTPAIRGPKCPRVNPLPELGLDNVIGQTWILDLRVGRDAIFGGLRDRARGELKKAGRNGVTVREADRPGDVDLYYSLHVETYRRTGVTPHPRAYFDHMWRDFVAAGHAVAFFAEQDGEPIAARTFALWRQAGVYWTGAASKRGLEVGAGSRAHWQAIEWMLDHGYEWLENGDAFPGSEDPKLQGLSLHKASFGGELYPAYHGERRFRHRGESALEGLKLLLEAVRP
jgi:hypothetical protein